MAHTYFVFFDCRSIVFRRHYVHLELTVAPGLDEIGELNLTSSCVPVGNVARRCLLLRINFVHGFKKGSSRGLVNLVHFHRPFIINLRYLEHICSSVKTLTYSLMHSFRTFWSQQAFRCTAQKRCTPTLTYLLHSSVSSKWYSVDIVDSREYYNFEFAGSKARSLCELVTEV